METLLELWAWMHSHSWALPIGVLPLLLPLLGFLNAFDDRSSRSQVTTSLYENAFNTSSSEISSLDGSTNLTISPDPSGSSSNSGLVVIAFAAVLVLSGLYLITRRQ